MSNVNKVTIGDIKKLHEDIGKIKTIGEWKKLVKKFATEFDLTDMEAINIANK